jgi:flagellar hook protein FlgE
MATGLRQDMVLVLFKLIATVIEVPMSINSILSVGVQGVQAGIDRANQAAGQIAGVGTNLESGDLALPIINLKISELQVKASADVIKTADQMLGTLIDINA